jgi:hypothetical protein
MGLTRSHKERAFLAAPLIGAAAAVALNLGFNWFRYGTAVNAMLRESRMIVPNSHQQWTQALALFFSPNGGLLFFATLWLAILAAVAIRCGYELKHGELQSFLLQPAYEAALKLESTLWPRLLYLLVIAGLTWAVAHAASVGGLPGRPHAPAPSLERRV